jgi:hypothetical protein
MQTRICIFIAAIFVPYLIGQTNRGGISGTVSDASGAVVPGASVTVTNAGTRTLGEAFEAAGEMAILDRSAHRKRSGASIHHVDRRQWRGADENTVDDSMRGTLCDLGMVVRPADRLKRHGRPRELPS